jgi:hypothetical protein
VNRAYCVVNLEWFKTAQKLMKSSCPVHYSTQYKPNTKKIKKYQKEKSITHLPMRYLFYYPEQILWWSEIVN